MRLAIAKAHEGIAHGPVAVRRRRRPRRRAAELRAQRRAARRIDVSAHAEIHALRVAGARLGSTDLAGCVVYTTGEPCAMCFGACHWAHVARIVYGASIADSAALGFGELRDPQPDPARDRRQPVELVGGVLRDECLGIFRAWREAGRSELY